MVVVVAADIVVAAVKMRYVPIVLLCPALYAQHSLQCRHCFHLVHLMSVLYQHLLVHTMAIGQHAVRARESILMPTWTCQQVKWYSLQSGQVHKTDAAVGHQMTAGVFSCVCF